MDQLITILTIAKHFLLLLLLLLLLHSRLKAGGGCRKGCTNSWKRKKKGCTAGRGAHLCGRLSPGEPALVRWKSRAKAQSPNVGGGHFPSGTSCRSRATRVQPADVLPDIVRERSTVRTEAKPAQRAWKPTIRAAEPAQMSLGRMARASETAPRHFKSPFAQTSAISVQPCTLRR